MYFFSTLLSFELIFILQSFSNEIKPSPRIDWESYFDDEGQGNLDYEISARPTLLSTISAWYIKTTKIHQTVPYETSEDVSTVPTPITTKSYFFNPELFHTPTLRDKTMFYLEHDPFEPSSVDFFEFIKTVPSRIPEKHTREYVIDNTEKALRKGNKSKENFNPTTEGVNLTTNNKTFDVTTEGINYNMTRHNTLLINVVNDINTTDLVTKALKQGCENQDNLINNTEGAIYNLTTKVPLTTVLNEINAITGLATKALKEDYGNKGNLEITTKGINYNLNTNATTEVNQTNTISKSVSKVLRQGKTNLENLEKVLEWVNYNFTTKIPLTTVDNKINTTTKLALRQGSNNQDNIALTTEVVNSNLSTKLPLTVDNKINTKTKLALRQGSDNQEKNILTSEGVNSNLTSEPLSTVNNEINITKKLISQRKDIDYYWMPVPDSTIETTTQHHIVQNAKTLMSERKIRFFTAFIYTFCNIMSTKDPAHATEIANALHDSFVEQAASGKLLPLGDNIQKILLLLSKYIKDAPIRVLQHQATVCVVVLDNAKEVIPGDFMEMTAELEELYTFEDGDILLNTLPLVYEYPNNGKPAKEVTDSITNAMFRPLDRLAGTNKLETFLRHVDELLDNHNVHFEDYRKYFKQRNNGTIVINVARDKSNESGIKKTIDNNNSSNVTNFNVSNNKGDRSIDNRTQLVVSKYKKDGNNDDWTIFDGTNKAIDENNKSTVVSF